MSEATPTIEAPKTVQLIPKLLAVEFRCEVGGFNEAGELVARPKPVELSALEADIPVNVREWLWQKLAEKQPKGGG